MNTVSKTTINGFLVLGLLVFFSLGCGVLEQLRSAANVAPDNRPSTTPYKERGAGERLYETPQDIKDFVSKLTEAVGSENPSLLKLSFYGDYAMAEVQDPKKPENVDGYTYRDGKLSPPTPVKIIGSGKIADNVFPLKDVNLDALPALSQEVTDKLKDVEGGKLIGYSISRGLPFSKDIRISPLTTATRKSVMAEADRNGKLKKFEVK